MSSISTYHLLSGAIIGAHFLVAHAHPGLADTGAAHREPDRARWFALLEEAASRADGRPVTSAEVEALAQRSRALIENDEAVAPYPPEIKAFCESALGLFDHWREGSATALEVSSVYWRLREGLVQVPGGLEAMETYGDQTGRIGTERAAIRAQWFEVLARMASELLTGGRPTHRLEPHHGLSVHEAARVLGVSEPTMWHQIASGQLPSFTVGNRRLVSAETLERILAGAGGAPVGEWFTIFDNMVGAARQAKLPPLTAAELDGLVAEVSRRISVDWLINPEPANAANRASLLTVEHFRAGTASPLELAAAFGHVLWLARMSQDSGSDNPEQAHWRAVWTDALLRMARQTASEP